MGSRNGHAVLALWARLRQHGADGYQADVVNCLRRTEHLVTYLRAHGIPTLHNPHALTVVFPEPCETLVHTYQLACNLGDAHAVVMPSVTDALLDRFTDDYLTWWHHQAETVAHPAKRRDGSGHELTTSGPRSIDFLA